MLNNVFAFFENSAATFVLGSIIAAIISYKFSSRKTLKTFSNTSKIFIAGNNKEDDKLKISYEGEVVEKLFMTKIYFWNTGNQTIDKTDIVKELLAETKGKILDVSLIKVSKESCEIYCEFIDANKYKVNFEYLDKKDGAYIEILHTEVIKELEWNIKGTKINKCKSISKVEKLSFGNIALHILLLFLLCFALFFCFAIGGSILEEGNSILEIVLLLLSGAMMLSLFASAMLSYVRIAFLNKLPQTLNDTKEKTNV